MRALARILQALFIALSPVVVYVAVARMPLARGAWLVVGWIALRALPVFFTTPRRHLLQALKLPALALAFALVGACTHDRWLLLLLPSATQLGFAWTFGASLRKGATPLVEHFARMQVADLTPEEIVYCRRVTWIWAVFLAANASAGIVLAWAASPEVWTAFTGVGVYVFVATLFAAEYTVRSVRFRARRVSLLQRLLFRWFPPRGAPMGG
jgi:uncharacterized membrane protein